jgi:ankyrin repeat protein
MNIRQLCASGGLLVAAGALCVACKNVNTPESRQDFRAAIQEEQVATVRRYLDQGLDPNEQPTENCSTPLALAVMGGNNEIIGLLLDHGANLNTPASPNGQTVLHCVAAYEQDAPEMTAYLLQAGADANVVGEDRMTPLMLAAARGHAETVKVLLTAHPDLEARSAAGKTAVEMAAAANRSDVVKILRQAGAKLALPPPSDQDDLAGNTGIISISTEKGLIAVGETFDEARERLETGTRVDFKQVSPTRNIEIRTFNNQTYRLTYERDGKTGPYRLVRIEPQ